MVNPLANNTQWINYPYYIGDTEQVSPIFFNFEPNEYKKIHSYP